MRESRTYGSVRGARGNSRPYREATRLPGFAPLRRRARKLSVIGKNQKSSAHGAHSQNGAIEPLTDIAPDHASETVMRHFSLAAGSRNGTLRALRNALFRRHH